MYIVPIIVLLYPHKIVGFCHVFLILLKSHLRVASIGGRQARSVAGLSSTEGADAVDLSANGEMLCVQWGGCNWNTEERKVEWLWVISKSW